MAYLFDLGLTQWSCMSFIMQFQMAITKIHVCIS